MGITFSDSRFAINGVVDTSQSVLQNLNMLCSTCGTWLTYDAHQGKWAFVINRVTASTWSFNNSNIIGAISVSSTGIKDLYNAVKMTFPHPDVQGKKDFIQVASPAGDLYPNEPEHVLSIDYPLVNNQVQAQFLSLIQLKQSRKDQVITFTTDYSRIGVKAGDVIDVTNDVYGFNAKLFRVITVKELDDTQGNITLQITAIEYSDDTYDESTLSRYTVSDQNGIITQGNLGIPGTPVITANAFATQPSVTVTSTAPTGGLIDGMEFWWTTDTTTSVDSARNYMLFTTVKANAGTYFGTGNVVTSTYAGVIPANLIVKTRAISGTLTGPFSSPSTSSTFNPVQYPSVIKTGTPVVDGTGATLPSAIMLSITSGWERLLNLGTTYSFNSSTFNSWITSKEYTEKGQTYVHGTTNLYGPVTFTAPHTGAYKLDVLFDCAGNLAGGRGLLSAPDGTTYPYYNSEYHEYVILTAQIQEASTGIVIEENSSGGPGVASGGNDLVTGLVANLTGGTVYNLHFYYDMTSDAPGTPKLEVDLIWNLYTSA